MAEIASLVVNVAGNVTGAVNSLKSLEQTSRGVSKRIEANFSNLKNVMGGIIGTTFIKSIVDTGIQMDSIRQSFKAITGSAEGMNDAMKFIQENSARTGVNLLSASKDFRMLLGSAQGTGYAMSDLKNVFGAVSDASLVLGLRADDVTGVMRAFGQIMSKGTVQAEELKGQIGDRLPGALSIASQAMKVTNAQLLKMMENGTLMSKEFVPKFAEAIKSTYSDLVPLMQNTPKFAIDQLNNAFINLKDSIAQSGLLKIVADTANGIADAIKNIDRQTMSDIGEVFRGLGIAISSIITVVKEAVLYLRSLGVTLGDIIVGFVAYKAGIMAVTFAQNAMTVSTKAMSVATKTLAFDLAMMGVPLGASVTLANLATTALTAFRLVLTRIVFPVAIASAFVAILENMAGASDIAGESYKRMVETMTEADAKKAIYDLNEQIFKLEDNLKQLKSTDLASSGDDAGTILASIEQTEAKLKQEKENLDLLLKRREQFSIANQKQIELDKKQRDEQIAYAKQTAGETVENIRLRTLTDDMRKLETVKLEYRRAMQDIYESSTSANGDVVIDYSKMKVIGDSGVTKYTEAQAQQIKEFYGKIISDTEQDIAKKAVSDVSKFQKEMKNLDNQLAGARGTTRFGEEWENFISKFSKEEIAKAISSGQIEQLKEAYQKVFDAKQVKAFNDQLDELKFEDLLRTVSSTDVELMKVNKAFEKLGTAGNDALYAKNEILKQIKENAKNTQTDAFKSQFGTAEERWQMRKQELERQWGELSVEQRKKVMAENEKLFNQDETIYKEKLKSANNWGEVYQAWLDKTKASQQSWGEQVVSVFDTMSNSMTSAMTDFLDITSDGFADFGKMATSILQEVYKEILKVMVVKPLVNSIMGSFGMPTAWNGGIANGSGFQRFASGYIAGGGYSSYDSLSNDKIPALISKGESVIPASVTNANRGLISAMIASRGSGRKFADGYVAGGVGGNTKIEIINNSNQQMQVSSVSQKQDGRDYILSVVIDGVQNNRMGLRTMLGR